MGTIVQNNKVSEAPQTIWQTWKTNLSQIDWKTHFLVVLTYMLIGFGIALACSSFYIAFVAHPMIAMASPSLPIMSGLFLRVHVQNEQQQKLLAKGNAIDAKPGVDSAKEPRGIKWKDNNCWIASALQMFFHIPAFKKLLIGASEEEKARVGLLIEAFEDYREGRAVTVNVQEVKAWLRELRKTQANPEPTIAPDDVIAVDNANTDDANTFIQTVLKEFTELKKSFPPTKVERHFIYENGLQPLRVDDVDLAHLIPLTPIQFKPDQTMQTAINHMQTAINHVFYFKGKLLGYKVGTEEKDGDCETKVSLSTPPDTLSFSISGDTEQKPPEKFYDGMIIRLNEEQVGKDTLYGCDGFIIPQGAGSFVHYIACVLEEGVWWELNGDHKAKQLTTSEAKKALENATFVHYTKVCSLPPQ